MLFRMIQESLQNILKHANATAIEIVFNYQEARLTITICDNGAGFDPDSIAKKNGGLGLQNIKSRAALMNGTATVTSTIKQGTTITISIPYA